MPLRLRFGVAVPQRACVCAVARQCPNAPASVVCRAIFAMRLRLWLGVLVPPIRLRLWFGVPVPFQLDTRYPAVQKLYVY